MSLVRWDPFRELATIQERMNRLFEEVSPPRFGGQQPAAKTWTPSVDIYETEKDICLKAELPGMEQKDIAVEVRDHTLILKGERRQSEEVKEENYHQIERYYGTFQRTFALPNTVQEGKVKARYKGGILEITLPKAEQAVPKQIPVEIQ